MSAPAPIPAQSTADEAKQILRAAASLLTHGHIDSYVSGRLEAYGYTPAEMERAARILVGRAAEAAAFVRDRRGA